MTLIAIGDVHGCPGTLGVLLEALAPKPDDHLVFIGDYVDRGPDSRGVIERLLALEAAAQDGAGPACTFLRGNHDQMMLDYIDHGEMDLWRVNGGLSTLDSYRAGGRLDIPEAHVDFLRRTELFLDTPAFCFVHAGLRSDRSVAENLAEPDARVLLWHRDHLDADLAAWEKTVVCGHTPTPQPLNLPRLINIDTGAVYHRHPGFGKLTAACLPERTFVQVRYAG